MYNIVLKSHGMMEGHDTKKDETDKIIKVLQDLLIGIVAGVISGLIVYLITK